MQQRSFHAYRRVAVNRRPSQRSRDVVSDLGTTVTVGEYAQHWQRTALGHLRERTAENYRMQLRLHILPRLGTRPLADLSEADVLNLIRDLQEAGYSAWTIRTILTPLSRMLNHAIRHGRSSNNPIARLDRRERPAVWDREQRILGREDIASLLGAAPPRYETMLATAIFTGVRQGELLALTWNDIDQEAGVVKVRASLDRRGRRLPPKTRNAIRDVVLMPALAAKLETHRLRSEYGSPTTTSSRHVSARHCAGGT